MKCNRFFFSYVSNPIEVRDYISRLADVATHTYGPDVAWARLLQMLDNARCLGWRIPKFGHNNMPDFLKELTEEGINHIFENQAKILIDMSPVSQVLLEDYNINYPVRMVGTSTPAGDLIWKCHLLTDIKSGRPYIWDGQQRWVKTKGTKLVCSLDNIPYDENILIEIMGGSQKGTWPVPFLPESFSDHPLANAFSVEGDVIELVSIEETDPVKVLVTNRVPWYRPLQMDRTKALPLSTPKISEKVVLSANAYQPEKIDDNWLTSSETENLEDLPKLESSEISEEALEENLEETVEEVENNETEENDRQVEDPITYTNVIVNLEEIEYQQLEKLEDYLRVSGITSKINAEKLRKKSLPNTPSFQKAEQWLIANVKRKTLLANASYRIGALFSLLQRHSDQPVLVIHPKDKWAIKLTELMKLRGLNVQYYGKNKVSLLKKFKNGNLPILVASELDSELFLENFVVISVSAFNTEWVDYLNNSHTIYAISLKQLGFSDANLIQEHPSLNINFEEYGGPSLSLLKGISEEKTISAEPKTELEVEPAVVKTDEIPSNSESATPEIAEKEVKKKPKKTKPKLYRVVTGKGRPVKAETLEEAKNIATKKESEGQSCQILDPTDQIVYTSKSQENAN